MTNSQHLLQHSTLLFSLLFFLSNPATSFISPPSPFIRCSAANNERLFIENCNNRQHVMLFGSSLNNDDESKQTTPEPSESIDAKKDPSSSSVSPTISPPPSEETPNYPINVPSPILLASSMVLAIASTGSIFELTGGAPQLGFGPTAAIAVVGLPSCLFLFYAAILKGIAETEEDDEAFRRGR